MYLQWQFFIFIPLLLIIIGPTTGESWDYHNQGPDLWSDTYPLCDGRSQSPIIIKTACTNYRKFTPFHFTSAYDLTHNFTLINDGNNIIGTYNDKNSSPLKLTGGGLNGIYYFLNFHLHWGENYKSGSEHQINGVKYSGEIHFVHINPETNQIAVLGMFMQSNRDIDMNEAPHMRERSNDLDKTANRTIKEWKRYLAAAETLHQPNDSIIISLKLASLIGGNLDEFWRYEGSLTTPPCTEGVIWTIFKTPTMFTKSRLEAFRNNTSLENSRSPQPLYNRIVYRNFLDETVSSIPDYNCCSNGSNSLTNKLLLLIPIELILYTSALFFSILLV